MADLKIQKVDIYTVAQHAKVSISTVSRSFNHPEQVNPATRKKIDAAVRKTGYIRNRAAQTMHGIRSGTIGLIVPTIDHTIFAELVQAFSDAVDAQGFTILVATHGYDLGREYAIAQKFLEHRVDGVALIGLDHSQETFHLLESQATPEMTIWNYDDASRLNCVGADNRAAGETAAQHLIDLKHRDIGILLPPVDDNDRARSRLEGALSMLEAAGQPLHAKWRVETPFSIAEAKTATLELLRRDHRPTALLCGNDVLTQGAIYAAFSLGLRVPDDLSIIGIGDFKGSREMEPSLTTIRLPARRIGQLAGVQLAHAIIHKDQTQTRLCCDIELAVRATCKELVCVD